LIVISFAPLDHNVFPFNVAQLAQTLAECLDTVRDLRKRKLPSHPIRGFRRLLRLGYHSKSEQHHCNKD
jgi:hypothetical protein